MNKRVLFSDNGTIRDLSSNMDEYRGSSEIIPLVAAEDFIYIGSRLPFTHLFFKLTAFNILASTMTAKYWNGESWVDFVEFKDETSGLTQNGFVNFTPNRNYKWQMSSTNDSGQAITGLETVTIYDLHWIRLSFSADLSLTTSLKWIGNLFSNDYDLGGEYPDLVRTNVKTAFESGKTSWEEQHVIAARILIDDLVKKGIVDDGSQVLNRSDYTLAAVHKTAEIICNSFGDDYTDQKKAAREEYSQRMNKRIHKVDGNKNGTEEISERVNTTGWISR